MDVSTKTPSSADASSDASHPTIPSWERVESRGLSHIQNIQNWLLSSRVQLTDGPHRGGVSGWLKESGSPEFLYPEATGYYLVWLAFLSALSHRLEKTDARAQTALRWISAQFADGKVPTSRLYLNSSCEDWRNSVVFSFDAAMLTRGTALAPCPDAGTCKRTTLTKLLNWLSCFIGSNGFIQPYLAVQPRVATRAPERWSLAAGPHQTKLAAAVLTLPRGMVPQDLADSAQKLYWHWRSYFVSRHLSGPTHPILYHIEGLLLVAACGIDAEAWSLAASVYARLMQAQAPDGSLPSHLEGRGSPLRSDVLAQALRIGCILRSRGYLTQCRWEESLAILGVSLGLFVQADGSVRFSWEGGKNHRNTWSAVFSHQALCFFEVLSSGQTIPDCWLQFLV